MTTILFVGFLIGMQHALEADHLAAVSSMSAQKTGLRAFTRHGVFWGIGHALMLVLIAGSAILLKFTMSDQFSSLLEAGVGVMLIALGANVLWRLKQNNVHFHVHEHDNAKRHIHAHSHDGDQQVPHHLNPHTHVHSEGLPWRTFAVGLMHGVAGSAALIVLTAATLQSPIWGIFYIILFGIGSIAGMALLSVAIALPMTYAAKSVDWAHRGLQLCVGIATLAIGAHLVFASTTSIFGT